MDAVYDKSARQAATFKKEDEDSVYSLEFALKGIADEDVAQYDHLSHTKLDMSGDIQTFSTDDLDACDWFFNNKIELVGGFEGELPPGWQKEFGLDEKQAIVQEFLRASILSEDKAKLQQKFTFGQKKGRKVSITAFFSGGEVVCEHTLPNELNKFIRPFRKITSGLVTKKGLTGTYLPETMKKLGALYDEIGVAFSGYEGDPPLHHKALVMRDAFGTQTEAQTKKQSA